MRLPVWLCSGVALPGVLVPSSSVIPQLPDKHTFCAGKLDTEMIIILHKTISFKHTFNSMCHFQFGLLLFIHSFTKYFL